MQNRSTNVYLAWVKDSGLTKDVNNRMATQQWTKDIMNTSIKWKLLSGFYLIRLKPLSWKDKKY